MSFALWQLKNGKFHHYGNWIQVHFVLNTCWLLFFCFKGKWNKLSRELDFRKKFPCKFCSFVLSFFLWILWKKKSSHPLLFSDYLLLGLNIRLTCFCCFYHTGYWMIHIFLVNWMHRDYKVSLAEFCQLLICSNFLLDFNF